MRKGILGVISVLFLVSSALAGPGEKIKNFTLTDVEGKKHSIQDYSSSKAVVLMFIATQCPVSNAYNERMVELHKDYADKGITFLGINSNKQESVEEIQSHSKEHGFAFPVLKDVNNVIADQLSASVTPEIYVVNGEMELLYHGRIDDSRRISDVKSNDLRVVLDQILEGMSVKTSETKAFGCTIKRVE